MTEPPGSIDLLIYGATGILGRKVVGCLEAAFQNELSNLSVALVAPDSAKLEQVAQSLEDNVASVTTVALSANDRGELLELARRTRCIIAVAGPFTYYGEAMVAAACEAGTTYIDANGEALWSYDVVKKYGARANTSGACLIQGVGFNSVISDFGVAEFQRRQMAQRNQRSCRIEGRIDTVQAPMAGGLLATTKALLEEAQKRPERLPMHLDDRLFATDKTVGAPDVPAPLYDEILSSWSAPFLVGKPDQQMVWRTNSSLNELYGEDFVYKLRVSAGNGDEGKLLAQEMASMSFAPPPDTDLENEMSDGDLLKHSGSMRFVFFDPDETPKGNVLEWKSGRTPGHPIAAEFLAYAAAEVLSRDKLSGGFYTPVTGLGMSFLDRLIDSEVVELEWI